MSQQGSGLATKYEDAWLIDGVRTPFVDLNGALGGVSPIDLGIKVAREIFKRTGVAPSDVGTVIAGNMAQASYDAFLLSRHIGLYSGVPLEVPAVQVQRVCGTGIECILQASDALKLGKTNLALVVGTESMTRNPIAAYTHRGGFITGKFEMKDFLWEALMDTAVSCNMGVTAENLAKKLGLTREEVDLYAADSFARAVASQQSGFLAGEIVAVKNESFEIAGLNTRGIKLPRGVEEAAVDTHIRATSLETLRKLKPVFGGITTAASASGVVDGAAATLVATDSYIKSKKLKPLARVIAGAVVGVEPEIMGIGPVPAIRRLLEISGLKLEQIDLVEVNEAFGAQALAVERELGVDHAKYNVNGGAIAIGHPLGATGVRITVTVARELQRSSKRYGIASACIGGGQGIAVLVENTNR
ncbi:MAG: thiolase family protein [Steroidobacteraceae bacterium]